MAGDLWAVAFGDVDHGWAVRRGVASPTATVLATADAGKTWTWQYLGPKKGRLLAVAATDANHVWAVGYQYGKGPGPSGEPRGRQRRRRRHLEAAAPARGRRPFRVAFADARHGWLLDGWHNVVYRDLRRGRALARQLLPEGRWCRPARRRRDQREPLLDRRVPRARVRVRGPHR